MAAGQEVVKGLAHCRVIADRNIAETIGQGPTDAVLHRDGRTYGVTGTITVEPPQPKWAFRKILDALGTIFRGRNSESYCVFVQSADQAAAIIDPEIRSHEMNRKLPVNSYCNNCHGQVNGTISREA